MERSPGADSIPAGWVEKVTVKRMTTDSAEQVEDLVVRELPLTIILNGTELVTLLCSPADLKYLALGFLSSEGLLKNKSDVKRVTVDEGKGVVRVETTKEAVVEGEEVFKRVITPGCGRGASFYSAADAGMEKIESSLRVSAAGILETMKRFQQHSVLYRSTHGVHSSALCDDKDILIFSEDIGRHNAIDKIFGRCLEQGMAVDNLMIMTSGRVSSEIVIKVARRKVPVLVSKSAPTTTAVKLAGELGLTLAGFVRGAHMNVYTHSERIVLTL